MPVGVKKILSVITVSVCASVSFAQDNSTVSRENWTYVSPYYDSDSNWWTDFGDSTLDSLIELGRTNSYDIAAAIKRVDAAKALVGIAKSGYYPSVNISAGWTKERMSGMTSATKVPSTTTDYFSAAASAAWEIDIFGKVRAGVNQKKASYRATRAEYEGVMLSITAEIASTYFNYRVAQAQLAVALDHSASQLKVVKITEARHETGLASALDVAQAKTVYYSTLSTIAPLRAQIHSLRNSLALLTGLDADALPASIDSLKQLPQCNPVPLTGVPADIIRRRPDIMQSEQNVSAAAAAVGIAKKDFLPTLTINGAIGTSSHDAGNLFKSGSFTYS
ncbi:MAG: efflux transporter outer membrane subunit, partial [Paramuribaculum sp.]|nr:efflux transporter outer membrane subunit [Paramuribaculum sp.]